MFRSNPDQVITPARKLLAALLSFGLLAALPLSGAQAQFEVESPEVEEGALEIEALGAVLWGYDSPEEEDGEEEEQLRHGHEFAVGYGVTDFWKPTISLELEENRGDSFEASAIGFENTFAYPEEFELGGDVEASVGFFASFEAALDSDEAHGFEFGPIAQLETGPLVTTLNPFFEVEVGDDREDGVAFAYGFQTRWNFTDEEEDDFQFGLGVEAYGEIEDFADDAPSTSDQEHRVGPVAYLGTDLGPGEIGLDVGVLFGLTSATSDYGIKWNLEYEIEF